MYETRCRCLDLSNLPILAPSSDQQKLGRWGFHRKGRRIDLLIYAGREAFQSDQE